MPALARKSIPEPEAVSERKRRVFHASVLVTRLEEWFVEAENAEQARALIAAGDGHRAVSGERVHVEVERMLEGGG